VLVLAEFRRGALLLGRSDPRAAQALETWIAAIERRFDERVLPISQEVAYGWARLIVPDPLPVIDGLLAATALVHGLTLVTRNIKDIARTGVPLLNPFEVQT